ncbi:MAG: S41 family peptidase [Rhodobacteraceae bacterium]|nr:S41 family peptidase [Paracoccaceae bacterium]
MKKPIVASTACTAVWLLFAAVQPLSAQDEETGLDKYESIELFAESLQMIRERHVEEVDIDELIFAAIEGMLSSLDPHSGYLNPDDRSELNVESRGEFGGLGIQITMESGFVKVISPIDDTPAAEAGIEAGDFVVEIDGEPVLGLSLQEAVDRMRGPIGTEVTITVQRPDEESTIDFTIVRDSIEITAAEVRREGNALVARVKTFSEKAAGNIFDGITEMVEDLDSRSEIDGLVIDLRNNPGGLLCAAVEVSDLFLAEGDIVSVRSRGDQRTVYRTEQRTGCDRTNVRDIARGDIAEGWPIAVLINQGSASAAEIVAGALQDNRRAVVVGTQSFGKGSVQSIIPIRIGGEGMSNGGDADSGDNTNFGALRLTTSRYYTPAGRSFQGTGITPDVILPLAEPIEVEMEEDERPAWAESYYQNRLENDGLPEDLDELERRRAAAEVVDKLRNTDSQLAYALDLLRGMKSMTGEQ